MDLAECPEMLQTFDPLFQELLPVDKN